VLVRERNDPADPRIGQAEALGAWGQLDPDRALADRALGLRQAILVRVNAAEGDQPAVRGLRRREHAVVGGPIAVRLGEGKDDRPTVHEIQRRQQLVSAEPGAVGVG
jgi:hypothetical protein